MFGQLIQMTYKPYIVFFLCLGYVLCYNYNHQSGYNFQNHEYCDDLSPYHGNISLDQISGVWYGVEKIPHTKGEYRIERTKECFYIDIKEQNIQPTPPPPYPPLTHPYANAAYGYGLSEQHRIRYFVLEWHEGLWQDDYHFKVNTSHKGFWQTDVPSTAVENMYRFFGGVIQVLKVANNHLVLNFCMRLPHSQFYSVVLSRNENQLTPEDLSSIHSIFTSKHLSTSALKRIRRRLHNDSSWRSHKSNPWSGNSLSGSWRDVRFKRRKRDMYQERRLRVLWDEDGQTMEQTYVYSPDEPGLWTAEQWRPGEREMRSRGVDMWYPDDPPRHPEVIRVLKLTPDKMIINHCTELGDGGSFSLILRSYQRYDESTSGYPAYTSLNGYNQYQKHLNYEDLASLPEGTRYPNYNVQSSTSRYNSMINSPVSDNAYYQNGYNTPRYAAGYGQSYGQGYGQNPGQNFGQGLSSYELPFVRNNRDYCINRVPQTGIWVDRLMGIWYGVELVQHLAGDSRVDYGRTCIVIHISEPKDELITNRQLHHVEALNARFRQRYRHLRLLWDEEGDTIELFIFRRIDHLNYICQKAERNINILRALSGVRWGSHPYSQKLLYNAIIRSHFDYGSFLLEPCSKLALAKLDRIQARCLRIITGAMKSSPTKALQIESKFECIFYLFPDVVTKENFMFRFINRQLREQDVSSGEVSRREGALRVQNRLLVHVESELGSDSDHDSVDNHFDDSRKVKKFPEEKIATLHLYYKKLNKLLSEAEAPLHTKTKINCNLNLFVKIASHIKLICPILFLDAKCQVLANLANFGYDPVNYDYIRRVGVLDVLLHVLRNESNAKLLHFASAGICNCCVDPLNAEYILANAGLKHIVALLKSEHSETLADVITILISLFNEETKSEIKIPEVIERMTEISKSNNKILINLATLFLENVCKMVNNKNYQKICKLHTTSFSSTAFKAGDKIRIQKTLTQKDLDAFSNLTSDHNPLHKNNGNKRPIVHGALLNGLVAGLIGTHLPGPGTVVVSQTMKFPNKCFVGEKLTISVELVDVRKILKVKFFCIVEEEKKVEPCQCGVFMSQQVGIKEGRRGRPRGPPQGEPVVTYDTDAPSLPCGSAGFKHCISKCLDVFLDIKSKLKSEKRYHHRNSKKRIYYYFCGYHKLWIYKKKLSPDYVQGTYLGSPALVTKSTIQKLAKMALGN
ncbi:hypothetical protein MSG28_000473 [Choristoneura fumiferana]|uniref:Uncharacterized protein n=1 Tax=Choristoneura fumiferana TaxID=7141 RepID=A0ACC0K109_CHOFU|nr:hypothetical protein MSG28_000473 [Choristoneura fumiferana]